MTSHHDVAVVVAELRTVADRIGASWAFTPLRQAADLLETQAKALSEAERERDRALMKLLAAVFDGNAFEARALAAEARLAEFKADAMKVIEPFAKAGELFGPRDPDGYDQCIYGPAAGEEYSLKGDHLRAARAFTNAANQHPHPAEAK